MRGVDLQNNLYDKVVFYKKKREEHLRTIGQEQSARIRSPERNYYETSIEKTSTNFDPNVISQCLVEKYFSSGLKAGEDESEQSEDEQKTIDELNVLKKKI